MQDNQFCQNKSDNVEAYAKQATAHSNMRSAIQSRDNQRPMAGDSQPSMRDSQTVKSSGQPPFMPPPFASPEEGGQLPAPRSAPPAFSPRIPARQDGARGIRSCLYRNTFIWLNNGNSFWFYPTFVGRQAVAGFRWRGFGWTFQRINLERIRSFQCF